METDSALEREMTKLVEPHRPATAGPIAAVPARGCPDGVATRPGGQSARVCRGTSEQARRVDSGSSILFAV
jgi:hypothetical protein